MSTKAKATIEDLYQIDGKAELVDGELVIMSPAGGLHNYAAGEIYSSLRAFARRTRSGHAFTDNAGFEVRRGGRESFSPDAAFHPGKLTRKFVQGAPAFAAEVRSERDYGPGAEQEAAAKQAAYFAAGTLVVWDVDLRGADVVMVYRAGQPSRPTIYRRGGMADAEPAVPGWTMPVDDLFPED